MWVARKAGSYNGFPRIESHGVAKVWRNFKYRIYRQSMLVLATKGLMLVRSWRLPTSKKRPNLFVGNPDSNIDPQGAFAWTMM